MPLCSLQHDQHAAVVRRAAVKLQSVTIASNDGDQAPRRVKLFINRSVVPPIKMRHRFHWSVVLHPHSPEPMCTAFSEDCTWVQAITM